ncbi:hypothetical protein K488DRAFT_83898 [Vararia minispora EC-137]|uniref:Uncharacterized protein n=1 Tax=Vararia minispora EC-137 TaxID=1314806 RepID=A0ACB8QSL1_9AGAM|nr:hypothetical protein K488DRAFT_83898 [Vararia minispora EC-137]
MSIKSELDGLVRSSHVVLGLILWELFSYLDFDWSVITGKRPRRWTFWGWLWPVIAIILHAPSVVVLVLPVDEPIRNAPLVPSVALLAIAAAHLYRGLILEVHCDHVLSIPSFVRVGKQSQLIQSGVLRIYPQSAEASTFSDAAPAVMGAIHIDVNAVAECDSKEDFEAAK